jgi:Protein of unknown function (DUF3800)
MFMLQGYIDDSGSEPNGQSFLLSGFILETEQWERFSDEWQFQLRREPRIEYFKMHEAVAREGQFKGWHKEFVLCKIKDLLSVIEHYAPTGISCMTEWSDYQEVLGNLAIDDLKGPYGLLFQLVFIAIAESQKSAGIFPTPIDVDFDDQGKVGKFALQLFQDMKAEFPEKWKQMFGRIPGMLDEKQVLPLQAADMLAWTERNWLVPSSNEWDWLYARLNPLVKKRMRYDEESLRLLLHFRDNPRLPELSDI